MSFWFDYANNKVSVLVFPRKPKYVLVLPFVKCKKTETKICLLVETKTENMCNCKLNILAETK